MSKEDYNSKQVINDILRGDDVSLRAMYHRYKKSFMAWAWKWGHGFDEDTLKEAYLEAITVFYTKVVGKELTELDSSVENYLIGVGKNYLLKKAKLNKKLLPPDDLVTKPTEDESFLTRTIALELDEEQKAKLRGAFAQLGKKCQKLLHLIFFEEKEIQEVIEEMEYENENTLYASKARCLKQLKELITK
jgi:DNA-directed RNA polymerase specialized sigma24 family protein